MKESVVDTPWRTVQFFLTERPAVIEVESHIDTRQLRCSCDIFRQRQRCPHISFVKKQSDANGGIYPISLSAKAGPKEKARARRSQRDHRDFVLRYGRIEVV